MKNKLSIGLIVVALVLSLYASVRPSTSTTIVKNEPAVGALAGPNIPSNYLKWCGVAIYSGATALAVGTTTVCAIQSPAATSTLIRASILLTTSSTTASTVTLAKAATAFATTTSLGQHVVAANAQGAIQASTTLAVGLNDNTVFGPNQWFVVGMAGGVGTFSPVGQCQATWQTLISQ